MEPSPTVNVHLVELVRNQNSQHHQIYGCHEDKFIAHLALRVSHLTRNSVFSNKKMIFKISNKGQFLSFVISLVKLGRLE